MDEWIPISEAARRLGISDRQARRYANRLNDEDRQASDTGPTLIRYAALVELRARSVSTENMNTLPGASLESDSVEEESQETSEDTPTREYEFSAERTPDPRDELMAHLREEIEFLRSQLEQRDVAESELRRLLLGAQRPMLPAPESVEKSAEIETPKTHQSHPLPWWRRWRRS